MGLFVKAVVSQAKTNGVRIGKFGNLWPTAGSFVASSLAVAKEVSNCRFVLQLTCGGKRGVNEGRFTALLSFVKAEGLKVSLEAAIHDVDTKYIGRPNSDFGPISFGQDNAGTKIDMANLASKLGQIRLGECRAIAYVTSYARIGTGFAEDNFHIGIVTGEAKSEGLPSRGGCATIKGRGMFDVFLSVPDARKLLAAL